MNLFFRMKLLFFFFFVFLPGASGLHAKDIVIGKQPIEQSVFQQPAGERPEIRKTVRIAVVMAPNVIGKYAQSTYNVALATLLAYEDLSYELRRFEIRDESRESLAEALAMIHAEHYDAILAPLTQNGVLALSGLDVGMEVFVPTVHKRDIPNPPPFFTFGAIDYQGQIEALSPYIGEKTAIFYDVSPVGKQLKEMTEEVVGRSGKGKKDIVPYPVYAEGSNIIKYLSKPALFSKRSVILHVPVVKSSLIASHMTFNGIRERNILSTQINYDPTLLTLTQTNDRQNMILANSIIEQVPHIYESNALMNNDIVFDWINYATSIGIDYLVSAVAGTQRAYSMRLIDDQVVYPIELVRPKESGFETIAAH